MAAAQRFEVARADLHHTRWVADPAATVALAEGQVRLAVEHFALTANNITYAAFGEKMKYWQFFPGDDPAFGCIPVWGFAQVAESRCAGIDEGRRLYGYLPMGSHLVVQPVRVRPHGFIDATPHRAELARAYNDYVFCDADPLYRADREGLQALLRPLFTTSFLLEDFLAEAQYFGARRVLVSSASSKTAFGTAFCAAQRAERPGFVGMTSPGNLGFVQSLGCWDEVLSYDQASTLEADLPTVYVDFAGNQALRRTVHETLGASLVFSSAVGGSHWEDLHGGGGRLPGPAPQLFFAPAQGQKRAAEWGPRGLEERIAAAWHAFCATLSAATPPWVQVRHERGAAAVEQGYRTLLAGGGDAREGLLLTL
jgi:hypothetical protein